MIGKRPEFGLRATALTAALFAITLNFLQPLVQAALLRDGAPSAPWGVFCSAATAEPGSADGSKPIVVDAHECCLGLAHATPFTPPPTAFVAVEPIVSAVPIPSTAAAPPPVGIRDGPNRPRGPPSLV